jgi:rod shape-determining protein MreD
MSQQALAIGALLLNDRIVTMAVRVVLGEPVQASLAWVSPLIGMLLWIPVFMLLDGLRMGGWRRR